MAAAVRVRDFRRATTGSVEEFTKTESAAGMAAADLTDMDTTAGNGGEGGRSGGPAKKKKKSKKRGGRKTGMTQSQRRDDRG